MATMFLVIIYLAFIGLGLPDSLLGTAWPLLHTELGVSMELAGVVSMFITGATIVSSLASGIFIKKMGVGKVTLISTAMTAAAMFGFSFSPNIYILCLSAVPLGLGAGCVDVGLNWYVAQHYKAQHMSWLHSFWGIGATLGPIIMSYCIAESNSWRAGYLTVAVIQVLLVATLFFSLPLWSIVAKQTGNSLSTEKSGETNRPKQSAIRVKGVASALIVFMVYCAVETSMGLWGSSFLVNIKAIDPATAASWVSIYFVGITVGRLLSGFLAIRFDERKIVRAGLVLAGLGAVIMALPLPAVASTVAFTLIGLGGAPVFPCLMHQTPANFGKEHSHLIIGYQTAASYVGITILPPLVGVIAKVSSIGILPVVIIVYLIVLVLATENINLIVRKKNS